MGVLGYRFAGLKRGSARILLIARSGCKKIKFFASFVSFRVQREIFRTRGLRKLGRFLAALEMTGGSRTMPYRSEAMPR